MTPLFEKLKQFVVYGMVGSVNTVAGLAVVYLFAEIFHTHYVTANAAGFAVGLTIAFVMHRKLTFPGADKAAPAWKQVAPFLSVFAVGYVIQLGVLVTLHKAGMVSFLSQVIALGVYVIVGFVGHKYLTFRIPSK